MSSDYLSIMLCGCLSLAQAICLAVENAAGGETPMRSSTNEVVLCTFGTNANPAAWRVVNDTVMGGLSSSRMRVSEDGHGVFTGKVSLENNGGFASVRGPRLEHSLAEFHGIAIRVKGDGKTYKCGLRTDGVFHQAAFETKAGEWQVIQFPFEDFVPTYRGRRLPDSRRLRRQDVGSVSFLISDKQKGRFRLEIDWIKAYRQP